MEADFTCLQMVKGDTLSISEPSLWFWDVLEPGVKDPGRRRGWMHLSSLHCYMSLRENPESLTYSPET